MHKKQESIDLTPEQYSTIRAEVSDKLSDDNKALVLECLAFCASYGQKILEKEAKIKTLQNAMAKPSEKRQEDDSADNDKSTDKPDEPEAAQQAEPDNKLKSSDEFEAPADTEDHAKGNNDTEEKKRTGGTGRTSESEYDAEDVYINHQTLKAGDLCPEGCGGTLYQLKGVGKFIRIIGQPLATATRYHIEHLRCTLCGEVYKADIPKDVPANKYNERFVALLMLHKYYLAVPFNRQKDLQGYMGVPLSASTQWRMIKTQEDWVTPLAEALERYAAGGYSFVMDDTRMTIHEQKSINNKAESKKDKKATHLTGITAHNTTG